MIASMSDNLAWLVGNLQDYNIDGNISIKVEALEPYLFEMSVQMSRWESLKTNRPKD